MNANLGPPTGWSPPPDDAQRLQALRRYRILDSLPEQAFEDVVQLATTICGTPQAVVTFIDEDRQWFKASQGIDGEETERSIAFCDIAIRRPDEVTIVRDASQHPVFRNYPQVTGDDHLRPGAKLGGEQLELGRLADPFPAFKADELPPPAHAMPSNCLRPIHIRPKKPASSTAASAAQP